MNHFRSNLRDLEFNLVEMSENADDLDRDTIRRLLHEVDTLATGPVAESFREADRQPPDFDAETHTVRVPAALAASYRALLDGGWGNLLLPDHLDGPGLPSTVRWAAVELLVGANPALYLYFSTGPNGAAFLHRLGDDEQRRWARHVIDRHWTATMAITEADAGSDVGAIRTRAVRQEDGSWHLSGVKRFITGGEHDLSENILHIVLARPEGPGVASRPGSKGLSVFVVPKFRFDSRSGDIGARNGVFATRLEDKLGLRGSATCELAFGQHGVPAEGWLLGDEHDGIAQMFHIISWARMTVGVKAISTLSTGYLQALGYARDRRQGAALAPTTPAGAPVPIVEHPDVRRLLLTQKAYAEGLRALYLLAADFEDRMAGPGPDADLCRRIHELLLPVVKGVSAERAHEQLSQALQVFGGSGYLTDHPLEQYLRDSRVDSLYEGTTGIQSMDLFFRKILRDNCQALQHLLTEMTRFAATDRGDGRLKEERELLRTAVSDVEDMVGTMAGLALSAREDPTRLHLVGHHTVRLLMSIGDLLVGWLLLRQAEVASAALDAGPVAPDRPFYTGKVAVASYFARSVLPELSSRRRILTLTDSALPRLDSAAL
ncbi:acyl-CoA dehydrogenase [Micromonospora sp. NPDC005220]|uniref:acyl-CoA dehydrogenase n=1 Tax=Micromonospora sp. NPDC005220 TaxID=3155589 RepID=UPI0033BC99D3